MASDSFLTALRLGPWFQRLPANLQRDLVEHGQLLHRAAGAAVYRSGDEPSGLYGILSGEVRLIDYPRDGAQFLAIAIGHGHWFGELSTLDGKPRPQDAIAGPDTRLLHVPGTVIERLANHHPTLWRAIGILACDHARTEMVHWSALVSAVPERRVLLWLRAVALSVGQDGEVRVSQEQIAGACGLSRQTVNRIVGELEAQKLVRRGYRSIRVIG